MIVMKSAFHITMRMSALKPVGQMQMAIAKMIFVSETLMATACTDASMMIRDNAHIDVSNTTGIETVRNIVRPIWKEHANMIAPAMKTTAVSTDVWNTTNKENAQRLVQPIPRVIACTNVTIMMMKIFATRGV
jgi:hypothetical protein